MNRRPFCCGLACLLFVATAAGLRADTPDPLRLVPQEADLVFKIEDPARLARTVLDLKPVQQLQKMEVVREVLNSTNVRRFFQLVEYFEKKLGADKFELLDKLAGGGAVVAVKVGEKAPALLILQGKDEKTTQNFVKLALEVIEQELARQEIKQAVKRRDYNGVNAVRIGKEFYMASAGAAIIISNKSDALKSAVDLHLGKGKNVTSKKIFRDGKALLDDDPLAWLWVDLKSLQENKGAATLFGIPKLEPILNLNLLPPIIDLAGRSPFMCAGFHYKNDRFLYSIRFPRGLKGMPKHVAAYFPQGEGKVLPLLAPPNVIASGCFNYDLAKMWKNRKYALKPEQLKGIEDFEKISGRFLGGVKLSQLLLQAGSQFRVVVTQPTESVYQKRKPSVPQQAYGVVHQMRDPKLARSLDRMIRTVAIVGAGFLDLKMVEEKHGDVLLVTYRFPEDRELAQDTQNFRYAFSPCYAKVGDQFMAASTVELGRDLVAILRKEKNRQASPGMLRSVLHAKGLAVLLETAKEQLVTQFVLSQAQPIADAQKQVQALIELVNDLGKAEIETIYNRDDFRMNVSVQLTK